MISDIEIEKSGDQPMREFNETISQLSLNETYELLRKQKHEFNRKDQELDRKDQEVER